MGGRRVGLLTVGVSFSSAGGTFWEQNRELNVQSFIPTSCGAASFFLTTSCLYVPPSDSDDFSGGHKAGSPHPPALERILFSQISLQQPTLVLSPWRFCFPAGQWMQCVVQRDIPVPQSLKTRSFLKIQPTPGAVSQFPSLHQDKRS